MLFCAKSTVYVGIAATWICVDPALTAVPSPLIVYVPADAGVNVNAPYPLVPIVVCCVNAAAPIWKPMETTCPAAPGAYTVMFSGRPTSPLGAAIQPEAAWAAGAPATAVRVSAAAPIVAA